RRAARWAEMARKKSAWRRAIAPRRLRWSASRALVFAAPSLRRPLNFHGRARSYEAAARREIFEDAHVVERPLSEAERRFVQERARANDGSAVEAYWQAPWRFSVRYFELSDVEMLAHTGCLADSGGAGLLTETGAPENWNRDKIALLSKSAPVEGTALPVRRYSNYFHFMLEAALPLTAYLERHGPGVDAVTLVSAPGSAGFVAPTLDALARRYGARHLPLRRGAKAPLERAVVWRRSSPCSDWPMARRETAQALRAALLDEAPAMRGGEGRRLYLRRSGAKIRNLQNAAEVSALAAAHGFETLEPSAGNLMDQARVTGEASQILAVHGAALANLIFAPKGSRVVEILASDFCKSVYLMLSRQLDLDHHLVVGGAGDYRQNFAADLTAVEAALAAPEPSTSGRASLR
ncbi:MAG: glycosyltransferase family 61 protein, partial [Pseudomonadota bacterium]